MDLHHPPCQSLSANNAYYLLGVLTYDMLQALKLLHMSPEHQPKRPRPMPLPAPLPLRLPKIMVEQSPSNLTRRTTSTHQ